MFSAVSQLQKFHPDALRGYLADGVFANACAEASLIAITDWTLYPHMTQCWAFLREEVFAKLPGHPRFFFDLVDPSSRSEADVREMTAELTRFGEVGEVTLGLNQNEANILSRLTGGTKEKVTEPEAALRQAAELRDSLGLEAVVIHAIRYAVGVDGEERESLWGPYCENPKKSTGAGDRFNAGYALGRILDLPLEARLRIACASSGYFVRNGRSATLAELAEFLSKEGE